MRSLVFCAVLLFLHSCKESIPIELEVPWYISERIKTGLIEGYNFQDSLYKYEKYQEQSVENRSNYLSYIADLMHKTDKFENNEVIILLEESYSLDKAGFCNNLIKPSHDYVRPNKRPVRRYSMPFIIDLDFDFFFEKCIECNLLNDSENVKLEKGNLKLSYIDLRDQWFRGHRTMQPEIQKKYDVENLLYLDDLYNTELINFDNSKILMTIQTLILHSTDCDWTKKWMNIYFQHAENNEKYMGFLRHFLWRTDCKTEEIMNLVQAEIDNLSK